MPRQGLDGYLRRQRNGERFGRSHRRQDIFRDIATRLAGRPEQTAFDRGLKDFSRLLTRTVLFLVIFLIVVSWPSIGILFNRSCLRSRWRSA